MTQTRKGTKKIKQDVPEMYLIGGAHNAHIEVNNQMSGSSTCGSEEKPWCVCVLQMNYMIPRPRPPTLA